MKSNMKNKGFSLVELIVVIAVMAVLVGVLAPAYLRYVDKTRLQKDVTAVGEVIEAIKVAAAEEEVVGEITSNRLTETMWTYVILDGAENATESTVKAVKNLTNDATNLQTAVTEIVGSSISFSRPEVQSVDLVFLIAKDENYNVTVNLDTSVFTDEEVKEAFEEAFPHTAGASAANQIAALNEKIAEFKARKNAFLAEHQDELDAAAAIKKEIDKTKVALEAASKYEELTTAYNDAKAAFDQADTYLAQIQSQYDSASPLKKLAIKATLLAAQQAMPPLESALDDAKAALDDAKANEQNYKDQLATQKEEYAKYEEVLAANKKLEDEEKALRGEAMEVYGGLGSDVLGSMGQDEFWDSLQ